MKYLKSVLILAVVLLMNSCTSDDNGSSGFAMTAEVDGELVKMNNVFGTNLVNDDSSLFGSGFPSTGFTLMQGREGATFSIDGVEINIWIEDADFAVGTYTFTDANANGGGSYIQLINLDQDVLESTENGTITIDSIDNSNNIVSGTFEFNGIGIADNSVNNTTFSVTNGTFRYKF